MIYIIVIFLLLFLSFRYDINRKTRYRDESYLVVLVILIMIAGFRYRLGIDTTRYITRFYYDTPVLSELTWNDLDFGTDPLYTLFNSIVLTLGGKFYVVQLLHATFVNTLIFKYIKKHTEAIFISVFIYFIYQYAAMNMEEMRASMSLVLCLFANDCILDRKWIKGLLLYAIGCFFHASTILVMIMPLFFFLRLNKVGVCFLFSFFVLGIAIRPFINELLLFMEMGDNDVVFQKVERYSMREDHMEGHLNIFGYLSYAVICGYAILPLWFIKHDKIHGSLKRLEPLLLLFVAFSLLSMGIPIFYRYVRFYVLYYILFISEFIIFILKEDSKIKRGLVFVRALVIMFPLFFLIIKGRLNEEIWVRYHPYASVFDQELNEKREKLYSLFLGDRPVPEKY